MANKKKNVNVKSIIIVIICTILTSIGQVFLKYGTKGMDSVSAYSLITNVPLIVGFLFYAMGAVLLIAALRNGQLSVLYPFISLSFIWVTFLSIILFSEHVSIFNWLGIASIILGVSFIGFGGEK